MHYFSRESGPTPPTLIGMVGRSGSGKDYIGAQLAGYFDLRRASLASHLKAELVGLEGWPFDEVYGLKERSTEVRKAMQVRGTEEGRDLYGEDCWTRVLEARMMGEEAVTGYVVTDVRFQNEAEWVKSFPNSCLVGIEGRAKDLGENALHRSELEIDDAVRGCDIIIDNSEDGELDGNVPWEIAKYLYLGK